MGDGGGIHTYLFLGECVSVVGTLTLRWLGRGLELWRLRRVPGGAPGWAVGLLCVSACLRYVR